MSFGLITPGKYEPIFCCCCCAKYLGHNVKRPSGGACALPPSAPWPTQPANRRDSGWSWVRACPQCRKEQDPEGGVADFVRRRLLLDAELRLRKKTFLGCATLARNAKRIEGNADVRRSAKSPRKGTFSPGLSSGPRGKTAAPA